MLPAPIDSTLLTRGRQRAARAFRRRLAWLSVLATIVATLVATAAAAPAGAAQAPGDDVPAWSPGWSWTYQTNFRYLAAGTDVSLNENVTYTVAGVETFQGQQAYKLNITGTITGGSGSAAVDGVGNAELSNFAGSVTGTKFVRRSDLALLQETQRQNLTGRAKVSIITQNITATIDLVMTPTRGWRALAFPLDAGQSWSNDVDVAYNGGFSYNAGSLASGASTFDGVFSFDDPSSVANASSAVPVGTVSTRRVHAQSADGQTVNTHWWSATHRNDAQELLRLPLDGGSLTLDRKLAAASTPAPGTTLTGTITPSLSCAGGDVTVSGKLSTGAAGVPVSIALDKSPVDPGAAVTASATTTAGGNYSATIAAPAEADGLSKSGARASWGVVVTAGGATAAGTLVVTPRSCTTLVYTGDTSAAQGSTATLRAVLTDRTGGAVGGRTITFALAGGATASATTNGAGVAETTVPVAGPPRATTVTASYDGSPGLEPASTSSAFTVGTIATTTTVSADPAVVPLGEPVRFTANVAPSHGGTPSGTVQFRVDGADFGSAVALSGGTATSPALSTLGLGDHTVTAVYNGSADHTGSTSAAVTFRVREPLKPTTTTSTATPGTAVYGEPVTLGASVSTATGTPTGEVVFTVEGHEVGRAGLAPDGTASTTVADLPVGSNPVVATYRGDDVFGVSAAAPRTVTVTKAAVDVTLDATDSSTVTGEAVGLTATVAVRAPGGGAPDGTVQLLVDGNPVGAPVDVVNGTAAFPPLASLTAGTHTLRAAYSGSSRYAAGTDQRTQEVAPADTTVALVANPSPSVQDENVRLTASVVATAPGSGSPTGTVTFLSGGDPIGSAPLEASASGSTAVLDLDDLPPGTHQLVATYDGDADYRGAESAPTSHTVIAGTAVAATTTALTSDANPATYGQAVRFRAEVTSTDGVPSGTVQFSVDGQDVGAPVAVDANGVARSEPVTSAEPGDHTVIASFVGAPGFSGSGAILTQTVETGSVELDLTSSLPEAGVGDDVRFTVTVSAPGEGLTPTGSVQIVIDGRPSGPALSLEDGTATGPALADLTPGDHTVTAVYSGDVRYGAATAELTQRVLRLGTTTALALDRSQTTYGDPVTATATVTAADDHLGAPTGTVTFTVDGQPVATGTLIAGAGGVSTATVTLASPGAGNHTVRAVFAGGPKFEASTSGNKPVAVAKRATSVSAAPAVLSLTPLAVPLGVLRATVTAGSTPLAGVPVEFKVGAKVVCTSTTNESGLAVCSAAAYLLQLTLNGGYVATFQGDANHLSSTARGAILK